MTTTDRTLESWVDTWATPAYKRRLEIGDLLEERHPESRELLRELSDLCGGELISEAERRAIQHHGEVIMAAIRGDNVELAENLDGSALVSVWTHSPSRKKVTA